MVAMSRRHDDCSVPPLETVTRMTIPSRWLVVGRVLENRLKLPASVYTPHRTRTVEVGFKNGFRCEKSFKNLDECLNFSIFKGYKT